MRLDTAEILKPFFCEHSLVVSQAWLEALHETYPERVPDVEAIRNHCEELVAAETGAATDEERGDIRKIAEAIISKAEKISLAVA